MERRDNETIQVTHVLVAGKQNRDSEEAALVASGRFYKKSMIPTQTGLKNKTNIEEGQGMLQ